MKKFIALFVIGLIFFMAGLSVLGASEVVKKQNAVLQVLQVEGRGVTNVVTSPGEFIRTLGSERELHHWVWPISYIPRAFLNMAVRLVSGVNDVAILPWYMIPAKDTSPLTKHYDLPNYCWKKE